MGSKERDHIRKLREEANAIRIEESGRARRNRLLTQLAIVSGAVVVLTAIVALIVFSPAWFGSRVTLDVEGVVEVPLADGGSVEQPISSSAGGITIGSAEATTKLDYYFDFSCGHCVEYHVSTGQVYDELVASGAAQITYHPINLIAPYGAHAGAALAAVVAADPALFYDIREGLYTIPAHAQDGWGPGEYAAALPELGITSAAALEGTASGQYLNWVAANTTSAREAGITSTPTVAVNGQLQLDAQGRSAPPDADSLAALQRDSAE